MMRTIRQVAKAAGLSVRALHHYDRIGLLKPGTGANGYRRYGQSDLLRLQRILFYRALGLSLAEIARLLDDPGFDARTALIDLRRRVEDQIARHQRLARTLDRTLAALDTGQPLPDRALFHGIPPATLARWEAEIADRFGEAVVAEARAATDALPPAHVLDRQDEIDAIHAGLVALIRADAAPGAADTQALIARHHRWVSHAWRPDAPAYAGLGRFYTDHPEFRTTLDALHPGLAAFLAEAMLVHADTALRAA